MRSSFLPSRSVATVALIMALSVGVMSGQQQHGPKFRPDDPLEIDDDRAVSVGQLQEWEDGDVHDFVRDSFFEAGSTADIPALNVNTLDEVPDSSWFTNRFRSGMPEAALLARGPDTLDSLDITGWPVSEGKASGRSPGFRVRGPDGANYQLKFDPPSNPEMSTAAEIIGAAFYHAFGYNTVEMYHVEFDASDYALMPGATIERDGTSRPLTRADVDEVLKLSARSSNGKYRATARKYPRGKVIGNFRYHGTRPDDPNDIFPHEHRRELRANRVFAAWLNHDDSRGINSKDIIVSEGGRRYVKHFMYDFNSILGSGNQTPQKYRSGYEYRVDAGEALKTLLTLGLYVRPWAKVDYPDAPAAVGRFESAFFDPITWKPEYPIPAFERMRPEDAFWAARIIARFDEPAVRAIVSKGRFSDPAATDFIVRTLMERRAKILRTWLTAVTPIVDPALGASGLTFRDAAVDAGVAVAPEAYDVTWFAFDNATGARRQAGESARVAPGAAAPLPRALAGEPYVMATIAARTSSSSPARVYFRQASGQWQVVGIERYPTAPAPTR